jgi:hypothetical protein
MQRSRKGKPSSPLRSHDAAGALEVENFADGRGQVWEQEITMDRAYPGRFNQKGRTARDARRFGVLPFIADDKRMIQIEVPFETGFDEETGLGLAARAVIGFVMRANEDVIEGKNFAEAIVHPIEIASRLISARQTRLIGRGNEQQSCGLQFLQQRYGVLVDFEIFERQRADLLLLFDLSRIQDTIPLDKYSLFHDL